jgi:hypothetical protein
MTTEDPGFVQIQQALLSSLQKHSRNFPDARAWITMHTEYVKEATTRKQLSEYLMGMHVLNNVTAGE